MTNIDGCFLPRELKVGFQMRNLNYRSDENTKLGYVIYKDDKKKWRKEKSWTDWKDEDIDIVECKNTKTSGFKVHSVSNGYFGEWFRNRLDHIRVEDPRGWVFEITPQNLLFILGSENIVNKELSGEYVYSWNGTDLILLPTSCEEYKKLKEKSDKMFNKDFIKKKDLRVGCVYQRPNGEFYMYLGEHTRNWYETKYITLYNGGRAEDDKRVKAYLEDGWYIKNVYHQYSTVAVLGKKTTGTGFFFANLHNNYKPEDDLVFCGQQPCFGSVEKKFVSCPYPESHPKIEEILDLMEENGTFSPEMRDEPKYVDLTFDDFEEVMNDGRSFHDFFTEVDGKVYKRVVYSANDKGEYLFHKDDVLKDPYNYKKEDANEVAKSLEGLYLKVHPLKRIIFCENGRVYEISRHASEIYLPKVISMK